MNFTQPALLFLRGTFARALAVPEPLVLIPVEAKESISRFNCLSLTGAWGRVRQSLASVDYIGLLALHCTV